MYKDKLFINIGISSIQGIAVLIGINPDSEKSKEENLQARTNTQKTENLQAGELILILLATNAG